MKEYGICSVLKITFNLSDMTLSVVSQARVKLCLSLVRFLNKHSISEPQQVFHFEVEQGGC